MTMPLVSPEVEQLCDRADDQQSLKNRSAKHLSTRRTCLDIILFESQGARHTREMRMVCDIHHWPIWCQLAFVLLSTSHGLSAPYSSSSEPRCLGRNTTHSLRAVASQPVRPSFPSHVHSNVTAEAFVTFTSTLEGSLPQITEANSADLLLLVHEFGCAGLADQFPALQAVPGAVNLDLANQIALMPELLVLQRHTIAELQAENRRLEMDMPMKCREAVDVGIRKECGAGGSSDQCQPPIRFVHSTIDLSNDFVDHWIVDLLMFRFVLNVTSR
jgi:hypothetical protein